VSAREFWAVARTRRMVTLLVLLTAAAVACGLLGSWQLDRAELRGAKAAQEAREAILGAPPVPVGELLAPGTTFRGELVGRRVEAEGEFTGEQLLVAGRAQDGHVGFLVLAELRVLSRFERRRMPHNLAMMAAMEGFERLFQADPLPLRWLRNSGLNCIDALPEAKALFVRQALGLSGDLPQLARV